MDTQKLLQFTTHEEAEAELRRFLAPLELPALTVAALCLIRRHGDWQTIAGNPASVLSIGKTAGGKRLKCSPNTFLATMHKLEAMGVLAILTTTKPWTYIVNWNRLAKLEPPAAVNFASLPIFSPTGQPSVNPGQMARVRVEDPDLKSVIREPCHVSRAPSGQPWNAETGLTDDDLRAAVAGPQIGPLRHLYDEAVALCWIADSEDAKLRFLTCAHHAATNRAIRRPMAALVARVKRDLDVTGIPHASERWAAGLLRRDQTTEPLAVPVTLRRP